MPAPAPSSPAPSADDILVRVEGVSKKFCRSLKKSLWYGLRDVAHELNPFAGKAESGKRKAEINSAQGQDPLQLSSFPISGFQPSLREGEFWAVNDVSFELRRGECLGLIGHNGAGKTTLLKMLNGLIKPDAGRIEMRGRVGALIALGAGFNPILTGRENIYVNGAVLGLSKAEIDAKLDEIIDFAEIGEFIDAPVQSYSSGMAVRLGFAVATTIKPDVLLLDEVLAVGDASFRHKCYTKIGQLRSNSAVIFVSHAMDQMARICESGMHLKRGHTTGKRRISEAIEQYEQSAGSPEGSKSEEFAKFNSPITSGCIKNPSNSVLFGGALELFIELNLTSDLESGFFRLLVYSADGFTAAEWNSEAAGCTFPLKTGLNRFYLNIPNISLRANIYTLSFQVFDSSNITPLCWLHRFGRLDVNGPRLGISSYLISNGSLTKQSG